MALSTLQELSRRVPQLTGQATTRAQAAAQTQGITQVAQAARRGAPARAAVQALAEQTAQQRGEIELKGIQQQQQAQASLGQQALQEQAAQSQFRVETQKLAIEQELERKSVADAQRLSGLNIELGNEVFLVSLDNQRAIANLGTEIENKIFQAQRRFERDEAGRKFSNERQLALFAVTSAGNQQQLQDRLQTMDQISRRKTLMLELAMDRAIQLREAEFSRLSASDRSRKRLELAQKKKEWQDTARREEAKRRNNAAMLSGALTIGGALIGTFVAPGVGTAAGAAIGGAAAGAISAGGT